MRHVERLCETAERVGAADPDELSSQIVVLFEGAITLRQVTGDHPAAVTARKVAETRVDRALASGCRDRCPDGTLVDSMRFTP